MGDEYSVVGLSLEQTRECRRELISDLEANLGKPQFNHNDPNQRAIFLRDNSKVLVYRVQDLGEGDASFTIKSVDYEIETFVSRTTAKYRLVYSRNN